MQDNLLVRSDDAVLPLDDLILLWQRLLDIPFVGADDDFFELGGDSLQALYMFHEIERITGRELPITAIYDASTPARLAQLVNSMLAQPRFSPLIELKRGTGTPLFIAHGIGGNVIELKKLGQLIDTARPIYAIQAQGVDGTDAPLDRLENMVELYLAHVREVQPHGPYFLSGHSFGGLVALEMARRLEAAGEHVAFLGFIDSFAHPQTFPKSARQLVRLHTVVDAFRTMPFGQACAFVRAKLTQRGGAAHDVGALLARFPTAGNTETLRKVYDGAFTALTRYWPTAYAGHVEFFQPQTSIFPVAPKRVWGKLIPDMKVHRLPGTHDSAVRENVPELAAAMSDALRHAAKSAA